MKYEVFKIRQSIYAYTLSFILNTLESWIQGGIGIVGEEINLKYYKQM